MFYLALPPTKRTSLYGPIQSVPSPPIGHVTGCTRMQLLLEQVSLDGVGSSAALPPGTLAVTCACHPLTLELVH